MTEKIKTTQIGKYQFTDSLIYAVKLTEKFNKIFCQQLFEKLKADISPDELLVLDLTHNNPSICQRDLAKLLVKDRANTGRLLESLEKKNLIKRVVDVRNKRLVKKTELTPEGEKVLNNMMGEIIPIFDKVYESFTVEDIETAKNILKKMRDTLQEIVNIQI